MVQNMDINVSTLTDSEQDLILEVLRRDEELRRLEELRVKRLKAEFLGIRRKGAKRSSGKYSEHSCGRCQESMSLLSRNSSQCRACKHYVCKKCESVRPNGSWVCTVCSKEIDLKMSTGEWFFDERVNRYSAAPGHVLVRVSLRKRPGSNKRETAGESLLNKCDLNSSQAVPMPVPVPKPRLKDVALANKSSPLEPNDGLDVQEQQRSETESAEIASLGSNHTETESSHNTPQMQRKEEVTAKISPAGSTVSSLAAPANTDIPATSTLTNERASLIHHINAFPDSLQDVDGLFKKSVRRVHKLSEIKPVSTLDLREDGKYPTASSMGDRSKSVPGLNADDEEEEEDIDILVNIHRLKCSDGHGSLRSSTMTLGSTMSVYSEAGDYDSVDVSGDINFSFCYDESSQSLSILVHECRGLAYADAAKKKCNPYVKAYLLPEKGKKKTSIKHNTVNPSFKETLKYSITRTQLLTRRLQLSVWHYDRFGHNVFLGEVEVSMDNPDIESGHEECMALRGKASTAASPFDQFRGELAVSLKYVTANTTHGESPKRKSKKSKAEEDSELHVLIKEAKNLSAMKSGRTYDSFVKGYLLPSKNKNHSKRKTQVVKKTLNPHYDHTFVFKDLNLEQLKDMCLELTVWDREALSSNDFLGGLRLSLGAVTVKEGKSEWVADSTGEEISLWQKMMQYPDSWAEGTLPLRSSMGRGK
ncbi:synaptotagmin-like protein 4 [Triplophysa dalaica]|uniref:synaptotagmin-like protein 4 n=1 Tax=Triplophysa dalaica TaxID=1582913 RepID=UPI0024E01F86|nr:synaptotagmin-like protein 4 [Triplophysa dalaica]XP_056626192.1 synaptotagmin-like protein 4 [Triplophysa dalaica]XP_056626193.1 synaptotagmin-like protein 4 [Triplophysa dalaica]